MAQGEEQIIVTVKAERDDDTTNNAASLAFTVGVKPKSVIVNEIMYAPPGDMPEWIEFYNPGTSPVEIGGWRISDSHLRTKAVVTSSPYQLGPGEYLVVASDSTLKRYFQVPSPVFVAPFPALNNTTPDAIELLDEGGLTMDSVWYQPDWGGTNGESLERVDYSGSSCDSVNWKSAVPTPGCENRNARKLIDVSLSAFSASTSGDMVRLRATVCNAGREISPPYQVLFYHDCNGDSFASPEELVAAVQGFPMAPGDSTVIQPDWRAGTRGKISLICRVAAAGDQRESNNQLSASVATSFVPQSVVINEIMYDPLPGQSEFIELFNRGSDSVDIEGWKIMDAPTSSGATNSLKMSERELLLPPGEYCVVAADSTLLNQFQRLRSSTSAQVIVANKDLSLNNSGDDIVLDDLTGTCIDSVRYSPSWNNPALSGLTNGRSLERINPALSGNDPHNWSTSASPEGATPGERNSIFTLSVASTASLHLSPNPFSPDNDGFEDFLGINFSLPATTSVIRVRIFDVEGRLIRILADNQPAGSTGTVLWDGLDDNQRRVRIGMYIILFEAYDGSGGAVRTMKDVAVVAKKF